MKKNAKDYLSLYNTWRDMDSLVAIFSLFGLVLSVIMYEYGVIQNVRTLNPKLYPDPMDDPRNSNQISQVCRIGITCSSIMACVCLY